MVELRALAYFATVCRFDSLSRAASALGIAPSTLSSTLKSVGEALHLSLFARVNAGLSPTAEGRWLLQLAEPLLASEEFARRWTVAPGRPAARLLLVEIGFGFTLGRFATAVQRAAATMVAERPDVLIDPIWTEESSARRMIRPAEAWPEIERSTLSLEIAGAGPKDRRRPVTLLRDPWVFAMRLPRGTQRVVDAAELARGRVVVPALPEPLLDQARRHFKRCGMTAIRYVDEPPGELPRLIDRFPDAGLFLPSSMVSPGLGMLRVRMIASQPPLITRLVARVPRSDEAASLFVDHLKRALAEPSRPLAWRPAISMRQMHYFGMVHRLRRVSAAAHGANVSQPALSEQLRKLERVLGTALFERRGDGMIPTAFGDRFALAARLVETVHRGLAAETAPAPSVEHIAFGILPSVSQHGLLVNRITEAVLAVQSRHPSLKLVIQEAPNEMLQDWVMRGVVGAAIVETGLPHMPRLPLGSSENLAAITHARFSLLPPGAVRFADLLKLPLALPTARFGLRRLIEAAAQERRLRIRPTMEIDALTMVAAVLARLPVCTVLPASSVGRELAAGELVAHPIIDPVIARRLYVIYSGERSLSEAERDLVNTLRAGLTETTERTQRAAIDRPPQGIAK